MRGRILRFIRWFKYPLLIAFFIIIWWTSTPTQLPKQPAQSQETSADLFEKYAINPAEIQQNTEITPTLPNTFHGHACTDDCSGHEAGYDWAEKNNVADISECDGKSQSFNEGCEAYVEEQ